MRHVLIMSAVLLAAFSRTAPAETPPGLPDGPHVVVVGTGAAEAEPDHLILPLVVRVWRDDAATAKDEVDRRSTAVLEALLELGFDQEILDVSSATVSTEYDYEQDPPTAQYRARRSIDVRIDDFAQFDAVVQAVLDAGVTDVNQPTIRAENHERLVNEAQASAIADANRQAASLATQFGRELGPVYGITAAEARNWSGNWAGRSIWGDPEAARTLLSFVPKPVTVRRQVYAVFELGEVRPR